MDDPQELLAVVATQHIQLLNLQNILQWRRRQRRKKRRSVWVRPWIGRRLELGIYHQLMVELRREDPSAFHNFMRMDPAMFDELLERLTPRLLKPSTFCRQSLEPGLKLAITIRHLASGAQYRDMQYGWRVPHNTISKVVREVCQAIVDEYLDDLMTTPDTEEGWRQKADSWYQKWNFPHTVGAIDGKHVACKAPPKTGSEYYNYKGFYSVILFAMVDAEYRFVWADVEGSGSCSDAQIFNQSELKEGLELDNIAGWPRPDPLPADTQDVPYFIVGDDAFSLRNYLMKPYSTKNLTQEERIFNYRLSRARRVVENAFGILANRFQVLLSTMQHHAETVRLIVKACLLLHNLMRTRFPVLQNRLVDREQGNGTMEPGEWRQGRNLMDTLQVQAPNTASREGKKQRNLIKHWCNSIGSVPWQDRMVAI